MFYLFLIALLYCIVKFDFSNTWKSKRPTYILMVLILILLAAFRYRVGVDTMRLEDELKDIPNLFSLRSDSFDLTRFAPGFVLFASALRTISTDFILYQIVQSIIVNVCCCWYIYRNTNKPFVALFFYFFAAYLFFCYETSREALSIALFLILYTKKLFTVRNILAFIICPLLHYGAIFIVVVHIVRRIDLHKKRNVVITFLSLMGFIFLFSPVMLTNLFPLLSNDILAYQFNHYFLGLESDGNKLYLIKLILILFTFLYFVRVNRWKYPVDNNVVNGFIFYVVMMSLAFVLPVASRFGNYFILDYLLILSFLIPNSLKRSVLIKICYLFIFNLSFMTAYYSKVANSNARYYRRFVPYHSVITMEKEPEREKMYKNEF